MHSLGQQTRLGSACPRAGLTDALWLHMQVHPGPPRCTYASVYTAWVMPCMQEALGLLGFAPQPQHTPTPTGPAGQDAPAGEGHAQCALRSLSTLLDSC
mmetsp:Transcript_11011/g.23754  ORF Transcript_11011/g.23754 Transcript_11011/m.23754 type:complete len:99 (-) Transcript_11011:1811-2107(-)